MDLGQLHSCLPKITKQQIFHYANPSQMSVLVFFLSIKHDYNKSRGRKLKLFIVLVIITCS